MIIYRPFTWQHVCARLPSTTFGEGCTRSRFQGQGEVITSHRCSGCNYLSLPLILAQHSSFGQYTVNPKFYAHGLHFVMFDNDPFLPVSVTDNDAITWTNVDLLSATFSDIHLRVILQEIPQPSITEIGFKITSLKSPSDLPGASDVTTTEYTPKSCC